MASGQRRFAVMGENLFKIISRIASNQKICRLLKYQVDDPFSEELPDIDGVELLHKQLIIVPKIPEEDDIEYSYIIVVFDKYLINPENPDYKISTIRFDVVCPYDEWRINSDSLRPYLIMQELDNLFNQTKLSGIGNLQFVRSEPLVLSPHMGGYTMQYQINEFN